MPAELWKKWAAAGMLVGLASCTSSTSTYFHRDDADTRWEKNHLHGVPITLEVPTHVKLTIVDRYFLRADGTAISAPALTPGAQPLVARDIKFDLVTTKKIFTVDFIRPAAGPFVLKAGLSNQYFTNIDHEVTDNTIQVVGEQVNALLKNLLPSGIPLGRKTAAGDEVPSSRGLQPIDSVVAMAIFKLDDPALESKIAEFLHGSWGGAHCPVTISGTVAGPAPPAAAPPPPPPPREGNP